MPRARPSAEFVVKCSFPEFKITMWPSTGRAEAITYWPTGEVRAIWQGTIDEFILIAKEVRDGQQKQQTFGEQSPYAEGSGEDFPGQQRSEGWKEIPEAGT